MPTDVMSALRRDEPSQESPRRTRDAEAKSGFLAMVVGAGARRDVRVVVYRTSSEHFAVVYPRKRLGKPVAVLSLKNATAKRTDVGFDVRQRGYDDSAFRQVRLHGARRGRG
ncbi:hypothetical protein EVAR_10239_1 [Eumeta japonica]|uniref:Uncharacterized protein n=1 Tax=Eumeta variegata TaxID=151549 RepID=A0A4C1TEK2_EUMVA|nr:hypothetical protein EVAR_10239_1 [Eumeta japonica]